MSFFTSCEQQHFGLWPHPSFVALPPRRLGFERQSWLLGMARYRVIVPFYSEKGLGKGVSQFI